MSWHRVNQKTPCLVCGRADWCGYTTDGAHRCMRVSLAPEGMRVIQSDASGGYTYRVIGEVVSPSMAVRVPPLAPTINWEPVVQAFHADGFGYLRNLASELNVTEDSLIDMRVGWSDRHGAWTFPMWQYGKISGVRLRRPDGKKLCITGSKEGVFYAPTLVQPEEIYVVEGASDTAALLSIGIYAVGRPAALGGLDALARIVGAKRVTIIADADEAGRRGASVTLRRLSGVAAGTRVIEPQRGAKDVREWIQKGATAERIRWVADGAIYET